MTGWNSDQLAKIGATEEVRVAAIGRDGKLGRPTTIWAVRHGDDLFVRSVRGRDSHWFRDTQERHEGRMLAAGEQSDVTFVDAGHDVDGEIDAAYRAKYRRYAGNILNSVLTPQARSATLKLVPRATPT
ncbi:MAG: DUF2255 family protein [Candidatus Dormibacteria bacterium]